MVNGFTLEKDIERALIRVVKRHGGMCLKWVCPGWLGVPDRICLLPGGLIIFAEIKRPKNSSRAAMQRQWAKWLIGLGFTHRWVYSQKDVELFEELIERKEVERDGDSL